MRASIVAALCVAYAAPAAAQIVVESWDGTTSLEGTWRYRVGDDASWADAELDESEWKETEVPDQENPPTDTLDQPAVWYRVHVRLSNGARERIVAEPRGIALTLGWESATVDEVFVDGERIGIDGRLSPSPRPSAPWPATFEVPAELLTDGHAVIAVRAWMHPRFDGVVGSWSSRMGGEPWSFGPRAAVAGDVTAARHTNRVARLLETNAVSFFLNLSLAAVFFLTWFRLRSRVEHLTFSLATLSAATSALLLFLWKMDLIEGAVAWPLGNTLAGLGIVLFLETLWRMFGSGEPPTWWRVAQCLSLLNILSLLPNGYELWYSAGAGLALLAVGLIALVRVLGPALRARDAGAGTLLAGLLATVAVIVYDALAWRMILPRIPYLGIASSSFVALSMAAALALRFTQALRRIEATEVAIQRFVPADFLRLLGRSDIREVRRGDAIATEMTVLFADIRGFTTLSEEMGAEGSFAFMNDYHAAMEPVIQAAGGFINQYYGDGVMVLFETPDDAVQAALGMREALAKFNDEREAPIVIGIGIHTGEVMLGTIGGKDRLDTGVISDAVNTASRIQDLTKKYGKPILISDATKRGLNETELSVEEVDQVTPRGKAQPITLFAVAGAT